MAETVPDDEKGICSWPIRPVDINVLKIPPHTLRSINTLISKNYFEGKSRVSKREIINKIKQGGTKYNPKWLLILASTYENAGWIVSYNKWTGVFTFQEIKTN